MKKFLAMMLALVMALSLMACGNSQTANDKNANDADSDADTQTELTYAVEAGSAGEEVATEKGWKINSVASQADALMEVSAGTSDAAVIDLLMAGAMVGEGTSYPDLKVTDEKLNSELYGVGCRKGSDLAAFINSVMGEAYADGKMLELAKTYGVQESLLEQSASEFTAAESDSDVKYIQERVSWWLVSPSSHLWTIRMKTISGSALTPTWPSWWLRSWALRWNSWSSTGI